MSFHQSGERNVLFSNLMLFSFPGIGDIVSFSADGDVGTDCLVGMLYHSAQSYKSTSLSSFGNAHKSHFVFFM